ncbi:MAG TPA: hypothetical protein VIK35_00710, partial [Verrucomicrobiae bacterium]
MKPNFHNQPQSVKRRQIEVKCAAVGGANVPASRFLKMFATAREDARPTSDSFNSSSNQIQSASASRS